LVIFFLGIITISVMLSIAFSDKVTI
jgi:hypothetical protein